jgi:hypothetical protein
MGLQDIASIEIDGVVYELVESSYQVEPVFSSGPAVARIGSSVTLTAQIRITADTPALLATAMATAQTRLTVSGCLVVVRAMGNEEIRLTPANYVYGGPHVTFNLGTKTAGTERLIGVTIRGQTAAAPDDGGGSGGILDASQTISTTTSPSGLLQVTRSGTYIGSAAVSKYGSLESAWRAAFPWPNYIIQKRVQQGVGGTAVQYELSAAECVGDLPGEGLSAAVDGEMTNTLETDPTTTRQSRRISVDLVVVGDPYALAESLYEQVIAANPTFVLSSARVAVTLVKETRLQAEWVMVGTSDDLLLSDWEHEWDQVDGPTQQSLRVISYPAADPVIVYEARPVYSYVQRGRAVGIGIYVKAPLPAFPNELAAPEKVKFRRVNEIERETTWEYSFVSATALVLKATDLDRPETPEEWT